MPVSTNESMSPAVREFLSRTPLPLWIDGKRVESGGGRILCIDPGTAQPFAELCAAGAGDVDRAATTAARVHRAGVWSKAGPGDRAAVLNRLADLAASRRKTLAELECIDVGKPLSQALGDIAQFIQSLRYYAGIAAGAPSRVDLAAEGVEAYTSYTPYGPCGVIIPWNFPIVLLGWNIAPALAAGNTLVVKPAEDAALSSLFIAQLAGEAGLPDGVLNVVPGLGESAGAALVRHPAIRRISFTGSPEVGRIIAEACGRRLAPVKLELGGKGAAVVLDDVDVPSAAGALCRALTMNAGQVCCTATRWLLHRRIYDAFLEAAVRQLGSVRIGYWADLKSRMGPLISAKQKSRVLDYLARGAAQGAETILAGGAAQVEGYEAGFYVKPAILAGPPGNVAAREEIFGPVAYVLPFETEDEAVELVNSSGYGLANSVWSSGVERARNLGENLAAGTCWINTHNLLVPGVPYAGMNDSGLGGGVLGESTYFDYLQPRSVCRAK